MLLYTQMEIEDIAPQCCAVSRCTISDAGVIDVRGLLMKDKQTMLATAATTLQTSKLATAATTLQTSNASNCCYDIANKQC
jgi:hypothetical protein